MKKITLTAVSIAVTSLALSVHADDSGAALLKALPSSKLTLAAGIQQAQAKAPEVAVSAKFEMDHDGKLALSVYTAEKGLMVDAEHNVLKELIGSPASAKWAPDVEVFKDVPHVSRSAQQLAVMALSKLTLQEVVARAAKDQPGTVYSVIPGLKDRKAVFDVKVLAAGKSVDLVYDAISGAPLKAGR